MLRREGRRGLTAAVGICPLVTERRPLSPGRRSSRGWALGVALVCGLAGPTVARAEIIDASSTTLLTGRQDLRDGVVHTALPVYELVSVRASELRVPGLTDVNLIVSGWGAVALVDPLFDPEGTARKRGLGDLDLAFVEGKAWRRRVTFRVGRQLLMAGAGRNWAFDGLSVTARPFGWAGLSANTGVPVTPRFGVDRGDFLVAARAFVKPAFDSEAGVSFLQVLDDGLVARRDLAADARVAPAPKIPLFLTGLATWSLYEERLAEGHLAATYQWGPRMEMTGGYRRTAPDLFLPRNSIFAVFSQETRDEVGGYLYARLLPWLKTQGDYHVIVDASGTGHDGSAKITAAVPLLWGTTVGVESRRLVLPNTGYFMVRGFGQARLAHRLLGTLDASAYFLDANVNGYGQSVHGAASLAWEIRPGWRVVGTGIGSVTPFAERRFEALAKLVYRFETQIRRVVPAQVTP